MHDAAILIDRELNLTATAVTPIVGHGECNLVHAVSTRDGDFIVRQSTGGDALGEYRTEAWCLDQAAAAGVPGPDVLAWGGTETQAFMIQNRIPGTLGSEDTGDKVGLWRELGRLTCLLNSVKPQGIGNRMLSEQDGVFKDSWRGYIDSWAPRLVESDLLVQTGVLSSRERDLARRQLEPLRDWTPDPALVHGNIAPKNAIVGDVVSIIDYGTGGSYPAPLGELMDVCAWNYPEEYVTAFCDGYGLTPRAYREMSDDISRLVLLRALDAVRWAKEDKPEKLPMFVAHARQKFDEIAGARTSMPYLTKLTALAL